MRTNPLEWIEWDKKDVLPFSGGTAFTIRSEGRCVLKDTFGLPLGIGTGEFEVEITGDGNVHFSGEFPIYIKPRARVQERIARSERVFTSLDRPSPLTPEMAAIQRMMRKNEMDRERDRAEMERRFRDQSKPQSGSKPEGAAPVGSASARPKTESAPKVGKKSAGSPADPDSETPHQVGADASADGVHASEAGTD